MKIHGLQKMTLLDFPGHVACTVFLGGCDCRCPFCHNFELVDGSADPIMDDKELFSFLKKRQGLLDGVAITGGEPCLRRDLPDLLAGIQELGFRTKLDTNGFHPDMVRHIVENKLADYVAMDVKNSPAKYAETIGLPSVDLHPLQKTISILMNSSVDYEFRTTVIQELHTEEDFHEIGKMIRGARRYFLQAFTDRDSVPFEGFHAPPVEDLKHYAQIMSSYVPDTNLRGVDLDIYG